MLLLFSMIFFNTSAVSESTPVAINFQSLDRQCCAEIARLYKISTLCNCLVLTCVLVPFFSAAYELLTGGYYPEDKKDSASFFSQGVKNNFSMMNMLFIGGCIQLVSNYCTKKCDKALAKILADNPQYKANLINAISTNEQIESMCHMLDANRNVEDFLPKTFDGYATGTGLWRHG